MKHKTIQPTFDYWYKCKKQKSGQTAPVYKRNVEKFISMVFNKNGEELKEYDFMPDKLYPELVQDTFTNYLRDQDVKDSTICTYLTSVSSFLACTWRSVTIRSGF